MALSFLFYHSILANNASFETFGGGAITSTYNFVESEIITHSGETVNICVKRDYSLFSGTADLNLYDANQQLITATTQSLFFTGGATEVCFNYTVPQQTPLGMYEYKITGVAKVLEVIVEQKELNCGVITKTTAQNSAAIAASQNGSVFSDRFGNYYTSEEIAFDLANVQCNDSGHFLLDFSPNFTTEEVNTICQVFSDLSALVTSENVDIPIRIKKDNLVGSAYAAATAFWSTGSLGCGIENNLVWEHMNTSADFDEFLEEGFSVAEMRFNLVLPNENTWHTLDMDPILPPNPNNNFVDLYSVTLHEAMHLLGFQSRILSDGSPLYGFYSLWDKHLFRRSDITGMDNIALISSVTDDPDCCDAHEYNYPVLPNNLNFSCLSSTTEDAIIFDLGNNNEVTIFGEYTSQQIPDDNLRLINTLSHLNIGCADGANVMHYNISSGIERRILSGAELNILCRLGYQLTTTPPACEQECNVVVMDDSFTEGFVIDAEISWRLYHTAVTPGPNDEDVYESPIENDFILDGHQYDIEIWSCDLFSNLGVDQFSSIYEYTQITNIYPGHSYSLCYSITDLDCGICDEGMITITVPNDIEDFPNFPTSLPCDNTINLLPLAGFDDFNVPLNGAINGYFDYTNLDGCDPLGVNSGGQNSPGIMPSEPGNLGGYLAGTVEGTSENSTNCESLYMPLSQPVFPGCSVTITLDIITDNEGQGGFGESDLGYIQIYGSTLAPCIMLEQGLGFANCDPLSNSDFECIESGIMIDAPITSLTSFGPFTWTNDTPDPINYLMIANNVAAIYQGTEGQEAACLIDNIFITQDCGNELTITPTIIEACENGEIIIDYNVCLSEGNPTIRDIELTVELPEFSSLVLGAGDFDSPTITIPNVEPGGDCPTVRLVLDISNNPIGIGGQLDIILNALSTNACIDGPVATTVTIQECLASLTCPCVGPNAINIDAGKGTSFQDIPELYSALAPSLAGSNTLLASNYCVSIRGKLIIDEDMTTSAPDATDLIIQGGSIRMQPNAEIVVADGGILKIFGVDEVTGTGTGLHACAEMWQGITVEEGGQLRFQNNYIEDARIAVNAVAGTSLSVSDNTFANNSIGLSVWSPNTAWENITQNTINMPYSGVTGNTFDGTGGLVGTLNGSILPGTSASMGIRVSSINKFKIGSFIGQEGVNTFRNLRYGVFSIGSVVFVNNTNMTDIEQNGVSFAGEGIGIVKNNIITNAQKGIVLDAGLLVAHDNNLSDIREVGIERMGSFLQVLKITDIKDNTISSEQYGIDLKNVDGAYLTRLNGNTITLAENALGVYNPDRVAIRVSGMTDNLSSQWSEAKNNIITVNGLGIGIELMNIGQMALKYNEIGFQNYTDMIDGRRRGISMSNSNNGYLYANIVEVTDATAFPALNAIHIAGSVNSQLCCNTTDGGYAGFLFSGECGGTLLRNSNINDHIVGLECETGTVIGLQEHGGNQWLGNYGEFAARHLGSDGDVFQSRFRVEPPLGTALFPTPSLIFAVTSWFEEDIEGSAALCQSDAACLPIPNPYENLIIKESDLLISRNEYALGGQFSDMLNWEGGKELYSKLTENTIFRQSNTELNQFFQNQQTDIFGDYNTVNEQLNELFQYSEAAVINMATYWTVFQNELEQIRLIEEQLLTSNSTTLLNDYQTASNNLDVHLANIQTLQTNVTEARSIIATGVLTTNNVLSTPYLLATNQKEVTNLYLERLTGNTAEFTSAQVIQLEDIAYQCPKEGGNAVYRARALLKTVGSYHFIDNEDCVKQEKLQSSPTIPSIDLEMEGLHEKKELSTENWTVYPNPTTGYIHLEGGTLENINGVSLISLTGQELQTWQKEVIHSTDLNINNELASGIYLVCIKLQDGSSILRKLVISK